MEPTVRPAGIPAPAAGISMMFWAASAVPEARSMIIWWRMTPRLVFTSTARMEDLTRVLALMPASARAALLWGLTEFHDAASRPDDGGGSLSMLA